ncbi:DEAD/DEAH box helicase, partial [Ideonella sp.]|uniref:DEAD/DEAH box helicase n=1 Tax=Ideonella sp. TaxID=1929293 RepID=UPI003BB56E76
PALDLNLLGLLAPDLQERQLSDLMSQWTSNWLLPPRLDLLAATAQLLSNSAPARAGLLPWLQAEARLLSGETGDVLPPQPAGQAAAATPLNDALRLAFNAGALCLQGEDAERWAAAEAAFDSALAMLRKLTGKRRGTLPVSLGALYVLSLLAQNTPAHWQKALKFCLAEGGKREPVLDSPFGFMAIALRMRLGEVPREPVIFRPYALGGQVQTSPLDLWRWLMRAWLKEGAVPEVLSAAEADASQRLLARLEAAGLHAWSAQLRSALRVLAGERAEPGFFIAAAKERWEQALEALQAVAQPESAPPKAEPPDSRLCWVIELDSRGSVYSLLPFEQKRGLRGWGKPKEVPLSRLQRTAEALAPVDAVVARCIRQDTYGRVLRVDLASAVVALIGHPQVAFDDAPDQWVELLEGHPELDVVRQGDRLRVRMLPLMQIAQDDAAPRWAGSAAEQKELDALKLINIVRDGPQRARLVRLTPAQKRVAQLLGASGLEIPQEGADRLQDVLTGLGAHFRIQADEAVSAQAARELPAESRLRAELSPLGEGLQLRLVAAPFGADYAADGPRLVPGSGRARIVASLRGESVGVQRDLAAERAYRDAVLDACPMLLPLPEQAPCEWTLEQPDDALALVERLRPLNALAALDWPQGKAMRVDTGGLGQLSLRVHTRQEWLALDGELQVDESLVLGLQQLINLASGRKSRFVPLGDGRFLALTQELRERLDDMAAVAEAQRGANLAALRIPTVAAPWLQQATQGTQLTVDKAFADRLDRLEAAQRVVPALPATLQASLRPYQEEGFEWAMRLAFAGFGACLADDMGLGKTLQALAVLLARAAQGPALVVAPTSLVGNWRAEARRFAPTLKTIIYAEGGASGERSAQLQALGPGSVVLVSYQMLQMDSEAFAAREWTTLVLDEAQAIKNAAAKRSQAVFELNAQFRLALSGTPIENRLAELWSIMRACNPGLLGNLTRFNERFAGPIERQRDRQAQRQLRRLIAPFILRRTKAQVLDDLPPRTELVLKVEPDAAEQAHYEALRRETLISAEQSLSGDGRGQAHLNILAGLTRLRRAACDPRLVSPQLSLVGAKVQAFGELAAELVANGHKALVFSQFVDFLSLLKAPLDAAGIAYQYLDGSTPGPERTRRVDAFQAGQGELFLISLKAGGFGLNLTVADYVVIADPWWNPAAEDQASGRAHRIGQQRPVTVYRLVNQGTLEEKILTLHRDKRELADLLLEGNEAAAVPQAEELLALMRGDTP